MIARTGVSGLDWNAAARRPDKPSRATGAASLMAGSGDGLALRGQRLQRGELSGAYVKQGDRLLLRQLRLGARVGDSVEVISGLQAGDRVASDPVAAMQALSAQRKQADAR